MRIMSLDGFLGAVSFIMGGTPESILDEMFESFEDADWTEFVGEHEDSHPDDVLELDELLPAPRPRAPHRRPWRDSRARKRWMTERRRQRRNAAVWDAALGVEINLDPVEWGEAPITPTLDFFEDCDDACFYVHHEVAYEEAEDEPDFFESPRAGSWMGRQPFDSDYEEDLEVRLQRIEELLDAQQERWAEEDAGEEPLVVFYRSRPVRAWESQVEIQEDYPPTPYWRTKLGPDFKMIGLMHPSPNTWVRRVCLQNGPDNFWCRRREIARRNSKLVRERQREV